MLSVGTGMASNSPAHQIFEDPTLYPGQLSLHLVLKVHSGSGVKESTTVAVGFLADFAVFFRISRKVMRLTQEHWKLVQNSTE